MPLLAVNSCNSKSTEAMKSKFEIFPKLLSGNSLLWQIIVPGTWRSHFHLLSSITNCAIAYSVFCRPPPLLSIQLWLFFKENLFLVEFPNIPNLLSLWWRIHYCCFSRLITYILYIISRYHSVVWSLSAVWTCYRWLKFLCYSFITLRTMGRGPQKPPIPTRVT